MHRWDEFKEDPIGSVYIESKDLYSGEKKKEVAKVSNNCIAKSGE
jgi:hypothetical protein